MSDLVEQLRKVGHEAIVTAYKRGFEVGYKKGLAEAAGEGWNDAKDIIPPLTKNSEYQFDDYIPEISEPVYAKRENGTIDIVRFIKYPDGVLEITSEDEESQIVAWKEIGNERVLLESGRR